MRRSYTLEEVAKAISLAADFAHDGLPLPAWVENRIDYGEKYFGVVEEIQLKHILGLEVAADASA